MISYQYSIQREHRFQGAMTYKRRHRKLLISVFRNPFDVIDHHYLSRRQFIYTCFIPHFALSVNSNTQLRNQKVSEDFNLPRCTYMLQTLAYLAKPIFLLFLNFCWSYIDLKCLWLKICEHWSASYAFTWLHRRLHISWNFFLTFLLFSKRCLYFVLERDKSFQIIANML